MSGGHPSQKWLTCLTLAFLFGNRRKNLATRTSMKTKVAPTPLVPISLKPKLSRLQHSLVSSISSPVLQISALTLDSGSCLIPHWNLVLLCSLALGLFRAQSSTLRIFFERGTSPRITLVSRPAERGLPDISAAASTSSMSSG